MNSWFTEDLAIVPGMRLQLQIKEKLHSEKSEFQKIDIYETSTLGRMLVLDDVIMCTEFDEVNYHEMIVHVPAFSHLNPEKALVIGGGDGGSVRELLKHQSIKEIHLCEIDERVVRLCQQYIPSMAATGPEPGHLEDSRVSLYFKDGAQWVNDHPGTYDIIIVDSSDPVGPAEVLFQYEFYEACCRGLTDTGILVTQAENFLLHQDIIKQLLGFGRKLFPIADYYSTLVPTYPGGMIGFTFFSKSFEPLSVFDSTESNPAYRQRFQAVKDSFKYYSPAVHRSAFTLPASVESIFFPGRN